MSKSGTTISYAYNADGQRISKTVNGATTQYNYAGGRLTQMKKGSSILHFDYDALGPSVVRYAGVDYYYHRNAQGDITAISDVNGAMVVKYTYDAWGNVLTTTGTMADTLGALNPLRYRGYVYDTETELYYLTSRYYNPSWGRFINADVFVSTGQGLTGSNMYAYCGNNPVMRYDPDGYWGWLVGGIVGAILGGASSAINDAIMGREVTIGSVLKGAAVGFVSGVVSSLIPIDADGIAAGINAGIAFFDSCASGNSLGESLIAAGTAGGATYASKKLGKYTIGEDVTGLTKDIGEGIVTFFTSTEVEAAGSVGRGVYKLYQSNSPSHSSSGMAITGTKTTHGGGRWTCKAMAW